MKLPWQRLVSYPLCAIILANSVFVVAHRHTHGLDGSSNDTASIEFTVVSHCCGQHVEKPHCDSDNPAAPCRDHPNHDHNCTKCRYFAQLCLPVVVNVELLALHLVTEILAEHSSSCSTPVLFAFHSRAPPAIG